MPSFGDGLGAVIGSSLAASDLDHAGGKIDATSNGFGATVAPYNTFGQSFLDPATAGTAKVADKAGSTLGYDDFMKSYTNTPAAEYQLQQADQMQNNTAAAQGGLLSGSNLRALSTINNGIISQNANSAYNEYLQGNNQQFGQLETSLGNMFKAIGVGTTATGQQAGVDTAQMGATSQIAQAQAKNDQSKGSGIGSMFSGLGSLAAAF